MKPLNELALQRIVERPKHLDLARGRLSKYLQIAETLKMIDKTKALQYDSIEFTREFGKSALQTMRTALKKYGVKKPRIVIDNDKVFVWSNDEK